MIERLEKAFAEASKLSEQEQETLAAWILEVLSSERQWTESLANSKDTLARLADEALVEHHRIQTLELNPDEL